MLMLVSTCFGHHYAHRQEQQLENQTAYVVTNAIVVSSWRWA